MAEEEVAVKVPWSFLCDRCKRYPHKCREGICTRPVKVSRGQNAGDADGKKNPLNIEPVVDFQKLPLLLRKRMLEMANVFTLSRFQRVSKSLNDLIPLKENHQFLKFTLDDGMNHVNFDMDSISCASQHLDDGRLANLSIIKTFTARGSKPGEIQKMIDKGFQFFMRTLELEHCEMTLTEFKCLTGAGYLKRITCSAVKITPPPTCAELSVILESVTYALLDITNFVPDRNWPETLCNPKAALMTRFLFPNVDLRTDNAFLDKFLNERMVQTVPEYPEFMNNASVLLKLRTDQIQGMKKATAVRMIAERFSPSFTRVYQKQFIKYPPSTKFAVSADKELFQHFSTLYFVISRCFKEKDAKLPRSKKRKAGSTVDQIKKLCIKEKTKTAVTN